MGCDYVSLFPTSLLDFGLFPFRELETQTTFAWARWVTERVLPEEPRILTMLALPFGDPDACVEMVEQFGDVPGVIGFMVTSSRYESNFKKEYTKLYRALEERELPLAFHSGFYMSERALAVFNRFLSVHAIGMPLTNIIQATNWIVNGMPERFPKLKLLFIEGGLSWVPFLMQRLDNEYMMRTSEAPLLTRRPSEYLREFFYSSQPLEDLDPLGLETTFEMINAREQLLWASDWPHQDWDPPFKIWDIPFLDESAKRNILGENARRLFKLPEVNRAGTDALGSAPKTGARR
jgi:predicted TIM-barrel fold metal-dependent hydrolase